MSSAASHPRLRLVGTDDAAARANWARNRQARQNIIRENRLAAENPALDPADPRWVLAVRTQSQLQGTALTPERRARVMRTARMLGIRPFDANVIIAIVQDQARRGEHLSQAVPTLAMLSRPKRPVSTAAAVFRWIAALGAAAAATILLIRWLIAS